MSFTVENLEFFLMILVRISGFLVSAPVFSQRGVPAVTKAGLSFFLSVIVAGLVPYEPLAYQGTIAFALLAIQEAILGLTLGYIANICTMILEFSGRVVDMEVGFSMVTQMNPTSNIQTTITGNIYTYMVLLALLTSNMYYYLVKAVIDCFSAIPPGQALVGKTLYEVMRLFMYDYFIIGFRIIVPIFACMLIVNVVLGVLAKVAPQMNMFVIGMQLKVFVGLCIVFFTISMLPSISDYIFSEMKTLIKAVIEVMEQ